MLGRRTSLALALLLAPSLGLAGPFQFELLGASADWLVVRENVRAEGAVEGACAYPGLDPGVHVGSRVHLVRLSDEARRGQATPLSPIGDPMPLHTPSPDASGPRPCTTRAEAAQRWARIVARAAELGVRVVPEKALVPLTFGAAVPADRCVLLGGSAARECRSEFQLAVDGRPIRVGVQLAAVPEAPGATCQYTGLRLGAALQVAGSGFGEPGAIGASAAGGFASHHDCRSQQFEPVRVYRVDGGLVLIGVFKGTSIADHGEYPFFVVVRPGPT